ncbi:diacylglycerol/lipid kinase family protein [Bacillus dakarensis]|uniref:diacylglycerol/lipid kinase family protein n=1 Tax=Robertmurraya dakarensis TaxID=1926278 RepID=UPI0009826234|nr:diacylglycerol kinase family protein [Bacillus dakarensis]
MKLLFFIINEKAGNGSGRKVWQKLKHELDQKKANYRSFHTKYPQHAEQLARQLCSMYHDKIEAMIAVGGDGTIHEVVNGAVDYPTIKVGFIPAGSGNDFSRGFGVPKSPIEALSLILKNKSGKKFDIGQYRLKGASKKGYFVNSIGTGFDAAVSKLTNESKIKKYLNKAGLGSLAYVGAVLFLLFTYKLTDVVVEMDGAIYRYEKVWFVTVSNQPYYGGGMKIAPNANPADGLFDVTIVHHLSRLKLLFLFVTVFFGKHTSLKEVAQHKGQSVSIQSNDSMQLHADGEVIGHIPVQAEVLPRKISFLVK